MATPGRPPRLRGKSVGDIPTIGTTSFCTPRSPLVVNGGAVCNGGTPGSSRTNSRPSSRGSSKQRPSANSDGVSEVLERLNSVPTPSRSPRSCLRSLPTPARAPPTPARAPSPLNKEPPTMNSCDIWTFRKIRQLFEAWDADGDGVITRNEVRRVMLFVMDGDVEEEMVDNLMNVADRDRDGVISVEEFYHWMFDQRNGMFSADCVPSNIGAAQSPAVRSALQKWFSSIDSNKRGFIDHGDFVKARLLVKRGADLRQIDEHFQSIDHGGNQKISWQEFFDEHVKLLDAIPRPLDEKVEMINARARKLAEARRRSSSASKSK